MSNNTNGKKLEEMYEEQLSKWINEVVEKRKFVGILIGENS